MSFIVVRTPDKFVDFPEANIISALRLPPLEGNNEAWITVSELPRGFATHLASYYPERDEFIATNGRYDMPNLVVATVDAFDRFKKGI